MYEFVHVMVHTTYTIQTINYAITCEPFSAGNVENVCTVTNPCNWISGDIVILRSMEVAVLTQTLIREDKVIQEGCLRAIVLCQDKMRAFQQDH